MRRLQKKIEYEGGQMPIQRRTPKRGFKIHYRLEYKVINVGQLDQWAETYSISEFTIESLYEVGLTGKPIR